MVQTVILANSHHGKCKSDGNIGYRSDVWLWNLENVKESSKDCSRIRTTELPF